MAVGPAYQALLVFGATACAAAGQLAVALYTLRLVRPTIKAQADGAVAANNQTAALRKQTDDIRAVIADLDKRAVEQIRVLSEHTQALVSSSGAVAKRARTDAAYRYGERWTSPEMTSDRRAAREAAELRSRPAAFLALIKESPEKRQAVGNILNFLEQMSLSVTEEHCDGEEMAKRIVC